jgi:threonine synthase
MGEVLYHSTNNLKEEVNFETALMRGMAPDYGLYMLTRNKIPKLSSDQINEMKNKSYAEIAFQVLSPFLSSEIPEAELKSLLNDAYDNTEIPTVVEHVTGRNHILWLTKGPTYSFKDYAARFFGRVLSYFLSKRGLKRNVIVATSGDTGGAVANALYGLKNITNIVFFPKGEISEGQRRQMTTLQGNVYAFEVNGPFDVTQALAKILLGDRKFAKSVFNDEDRFTSANSISVGRLLPQAVYPFFAYSKIAGRGEKITTAIPSGNFGDMVGTVIAREMGLPLEKVIVALNPNKPFLNFLETGEYKVSEAISTPSSAMKVSHPSNISRLIDLYGGHLFDKRDETGRVVQEGIIDRMPDLNAMKRDFFAVSISNNQHYETMKNVFDVHGIMLDPHGAVGWAALQSYLEGGYDGSTIVYETADPGKFPNDVMKAIGQNPQVPLKIQEQARMQERIFSIESNPIETKEGLKLSEEQITEAKEKIRELFS